MLFSREDSIKLRTIFFQTRKQCHDLTLKYVSREYKTKLGNEYACHGLSRRLSIMQHCVEHIYRTSPPNSKKKPSPAHLDQMTVHLHSFIINTYGCIDNISRIWVAENNITNNDKQLRNKEIWLSKKQKLIWETLSNDFRTYLESLEPWFDILKNRRDALAHRIPIYIPPYVVSEDKVQLYLQIEEQEHKYLFSGNLDFYQKLKEQREEMEHFSPIFRHSFNPAENSATLLLHPQILNDWNAVVEISKLFLKELDRAS